MNTIKLDRNAIQNAIRQGDNCDGSYVLAVSPDGDDHRVHWAQSNRQWDPWDIEWVIIGIPALFPDGQSEESGLAETMLSDMRRLDEAKRIAEAEDIGLPEIAERLDAERWQQYQDEAVDWYLYAFLAACNGDGSDLNDPAPWGYVYSEDSEVPEAEREPPAQFTY